MAQCGPMLIDLPEGMTYSFPKLYAVTVTVRDGERTVTRRYEAPTAEEAKRMAGEQGDDDTVEIVTLTEAQK